ncbi:hypothetical protein [Halodesulfovibrio aestuarii]|uniref:hypothetical protein n=1 Tax=Halodesulfovibrio aestuarii TaxID=126333 RepID=UPI000411917E
MWWNSKQIYIAGTVSIIAVILFLFFSLQERKKTEDLITGYYLIDKITFLNAPTSKEASLQGQLALLKDKSYLYYDADRKELTFSFVDIKIVNPITFNQKSTYDLLSLMTVLNYKDFEGAYSQIVNHNKKKFNLLLKNDKSVEPFSIRLSYSHVAERDSRLAEIRKAQQKEKTKLFDSYRELRKKITAQGIQDFSGLLWKKDLFTLKLPMTEVLYPIHPSELFPQKWKSPHITAKSDVTALYRAKYGNFVIAVFPLKKNCPILEENLQYHTLSPESVLFREKHGSIYFDRISNRIIGEYHHVDPQKKVYIIARTLPDAENRLDSILDSYAQLRTIAPENRTDPSQLIDFAMIMKNDLDKTAREYNQTKDYHNEVSKMDLPDIVESATSRVAVIRKRAERFAKFHENGQIRLSLDPINVVQARLDSRNWKTLVKGNNYSLMVSTTPYVELRGHYFYRQHGLTLEIMYTQPRSKSPLAAIHFLQQARAMNIPALPHYPHSFLEQNFARYRHAHIFPEREDVINVTDFSGKEGLISLDGAIITPLKYSGIQETSYGYYAYYPDLKGKVVYLNIEGKEVEDPFSY